MHIISLHHADASFLFLSLLGQRLSCLVVAVALALLLLFVFSDCFLKGWLHDLSLQLLCQCESFLFSELLLFDLTPIFLVYLFLHGVSLLNACFVVLWHAWKAGTLEVELTQVAFGKVTNYGLRFLLWVNLFVVEERRSLEVRLRHSSDNLGLLTLLVCQNCQILPGLLLVLNVKRHRL